MKSEIGIFLILLILLLLLLTCNSVEPPPTPPPPSKPEAVLIQESVTCTEVWLKLTLTNLTLPVNVQLFKDNLLQTEINGLSENDITLFIDSLLPNKTYNFIAVVSNNEQQDTSNQLQAVTLDTTSHFFSFQTFEFGDPLTGNSSILYDVAFINENNIWAVGEIYLNDSLGQTIRYNAVHWNGSQWELKRILYQGGFWVIRTIFAFSESDIWFSAFVRFDGQNFIELPIPPILMGWSINKIWGSSSNELYAVGNEGNIARYLNGTWSRIESGTDIPLVDIYSNNGSDIYISGAFTPQVKGILLRGNGNQFSIMIKSEIITENELFERLYGELATVWVDEIGTVYTGGNLLFRYKNNEWNYEKSLPENFIGGNPGAYYRGFISSMRGNASNDFIIAGDRNTLKHFNGVNWEQIGLPYDPQSPIIWGSVKMKNNTAVAVGLKNNSAYIILLNR
jgi:hypothetical protein